MKELLKDYNTLGKKQKKIAEYFLEHSDNIVNMGIYELADIIKEILYGIYYEEQYGLITTADAEKIFANTAEGLADRYEEE